MYFHGKDAEITIDKVRVKRKGFTVQGSKVKQQESEKRPERSDSDPDSPAEPGNSKPLSSKL